MPEQPRSYQIRVRNQRLKKLALFFGFLSFVVLLGMLIFFLSRVRTIRCSLEDGGFCDEAVVAELQQFRNKNMVLLDTKPVEQKLHQALPEFKSISIQKKFPWTIEATLVKEKIAFFLADVGANYRLAVLENGRVLNLEKPDDEFAIEFVHPPKVGETVPHEMVEGLAKLAQMLREHKLPIAGVLYQDENMLTLTSSTGIQFVLRIPDIENQLSTLHTMFAEATMIQAARTVDLRFTRPVITPR